MRPDAKTASVTSAKACALVSFDMSLISSSATAAVRMV
jgi:hypothetical protein